MKKWEYNIISDRDKPDFNEIGEQGWELVAVNTEVNQWEDGKGEHYEESVYFYFKREL